MASTLKEKLEHDKIEALKAKDEVRLGTLRLLTSSVHNREIEKKTKGGTEPLTDEEVLEVITKEAKKRKESIALFMQGGRKDLADKEAGELVILQVYLPAELGEAEVVKAVLEAIERVKPASDKDFGKVMGEAMKSLKGRADAALVSRLVKEKLSG